MDFLDSRHLTVHDGYIHPFRDEGTFTYSALVSDGDDALESGIIVVGGQGRVAGDGEQHDVVLRWEPKAGRFVPREEDRRKTVRRNDFVVFGFDAAILGQPPCFVQIGSIEGVEGDSRRLRTHEAFSHFFLQPGDYPILVGRSAYRLGVVDHRSLPEDEAARRAQEAVVVMVRDGEISDPEARIVVGQTVVWAVESGENVRIAVAPRG